MQTNEATTLVRKNQRIGRINYAVSTHPYYILFSACVFTPLVLLNAWYLAAPLYGYLLEEMKKLGCDFNSLKSKPSEGLNQSNFFSNHNNTLQCNFDSKDYVYEFNCLTANSSFCDTAFNAARADAAQLESRFMWADLGICLFMLACLVVSIKVKADRLSSRQIERDEAQIRLQS